ncbi:hypothetical protein BD410DRAFT_102416 [Rickenella mellea]|uniref:Uncharacterized protein n=1 Tax=Rickenella mellea TaxID=50990 RepID=A0A4Y7PLD6_9AGAM|nr:hypothetical protein BD410DRAFT_102416 [Rickenella mellea]
MIVEERNSMWTWCRRDAQRKASLQWRSGAVTWSWCLTERTLGNVRLTRLMSRNGLEVAKSRPSPNCFSETDTWTTPTSEESTTSELGSVVAMFPNPTNEECFQDILPLVIPFGEDDTKLGECREETQSPTFCGSSYHPTSA